MKNQEVDIAILLNLCKENNEKAQLTIYNKYYKAMFNVAFRIVNDYALAEDIMQESFLKAFTKLDSYSGKVTFGAWLKKIVVNNSIDEYKKVSKHQIERLDENTEVIDDSNDNGISYNELKAESVLKTIQSLKPNYKIILTLFFIEGYDLEEITQILNISYENCRTMMSRAKESLRTKLNAL
ncbi:MAG: RNA polymerase sigma factor [Flavobacterium sp.]|uniref:RNA polymerase sigma factor n=1 Tax=Flavobacterium sp. TaxID=239 RepID=UPI0022BBC1D0|nr:RNA polymerase sigma factor [Flavobacterium sp.]MCZ8198708.1 RNA polymerase sigma factor [Flavobacterium sp.]